ncbi:MAG: outer membrane beta-barrel protein [Devosia sp.]|uniref:outer membrane protein n=1 Tax=Devosia sp. TaxID=1871048 RepID=UPI0024C98CCD|nr:outer membrane beta-barrel protein [Devosia sp.]UYN98462.1 MAG: outer membrane beta-barrel protein [Devosia sp.]
MRLTLGHLGAGLMLSALATAGAAAQQVTDWSGFYAGIYAGYALDNVAATSSTTTIPPTPAGGSVISGTIGSNNTRIEGVLGGIGAGYAYQHNQFVLGVDGAVHAGGLGKTRSSTLDLQGTDGVDSYTILNTTDTSINLDWYTTLTGSFGIAFEQDWLFYIKGGAAVANVSSQSDSTLDVSATDPAILPLPFPPGTSTASASSSRLLVGPTVGAGVEKMLNANVSLGAEYAFVGLPDATVPTAGLALFGGGGNLTVPMGFHTVKATLKYHF